MRHRFLWFLVSILLGAGGGLAYGWIVRPQHVQNTPAKRLASEYQTDYVLMVAEVYHTEQDPALAEHRLTLLGNTPAVRMVQEAIIRAGELGYAKADLNLMAELIAGLNQPPGATPTAEATP